MNPGRVAARLANALKDCRHELYLLSLTVTDNDVMSATLDKLIAQADYALLEYRVSRKISPKLVRSTVAPVAKDSDVVDN